MWLDPVRFYAAFALPLVHTPAELAALLPAQLTLRELLGVAVPTPRGTEDGCVLLNPDGCSLAPEQRPCQCLALVPHIDTQMEGEMRCRLLPGHGSDIAHARWQEWWARDHTG